MRLEEFCQKFELLGIPGFSLPFLAGVLSDSSAYYRSFAIPKRKGGSRRIDSPYPVLSEVQRAIANRLVNTYSVAEEAFAYVAGRSSFQHAALHAAHDELLVVDIKDFFGSITRQMVFQALAEDAEFVEYAHAISLICTLRGRLPQGAPTSPFLSNLVFKSMDRRLRGLASRVGLVYSRYADDLAFSGESVPRNLPSYLARLVSSGGYSLNATKTRLKLKGRKKVLTGISISRGVLKAPRSFVRELRSQIFYIERRMGLVVEQKEFDPFIFERAIGRLNYWLQIEPENKYALSKKIVLSQAHRGFLGLSCAVGD